MVVGGGGGGGGGGFQIHFLNSQHTCIWLVGGGGGGGDLFTQGVLWLCIWKISTASVCTLALLLSAPKINSSLVSSLVPSLK